VHWGRGGIVGMVVEVEELKGDLGSDTDAFALAGRVPNLLYELHPACGFHFSIQFINYSFLPIMAPQPNPPPSKPVKKPTNSRIHKLPRLPKSMTPISIPSFPQSTLLLPFLQISGLRPSLLLRTPLPLILYPRQPPSFFTPPNPFPTFPPSQLNPPLL